MFNFDCWLYEHGYIRSCIARIPRNSRNLIYHLKYLLQQIFQTYSIGTTIKKLFSTRIIKLIWKIETSWKCNLNSSAVKTNLQFLNCALPFSEGYIKESSRRRTDIGKERVEALLHCILGRLLSKLKWSSTIYAENGII